VWEETVPSKPSISIAIPPTVKSTDRFYSNRQLVLKDKCMMSLPEEMDITTVNTTANPNRRYQSFDFMFDNGFESPATWFLLWQVWQKCVGRQPILALNVGTGAKTDTLRLQLNYSQDALQDAYHEALANHAPVIPSPQTTLLETGPIGRGVWHNFKIRMRPDYIGAKGGGKITLWLDGAEVLNWGGEWGYAPRTEPDEWGTSADKQIYFAIGIYRGLQSRNQKVTFRNIKFSENFAEV
jgi:hypothetical protein